MERTDIIDLAIALIKHDISEYSCNAIYIAYLLYEKYNHDSQLKENINTLKIKYKNLSIDSNYFTDDRETYLKAYFYDHYMKVQEILNKYNITTFSCLSRIGLKRVDDVKKMRLELLNNLKNK